MAAGGTASSSDIAMGVDVGGTKILAAAVDGHGHIIARERFDTPAHGPDRMDAIVDVVRTLCERHDLVAPPVGVGVAGLVDTDGVVRFTPNLDWHDEPVRATLRARLGVHLRVENDAAAAAWGEYRVGAARDATAGALMLTLGTGVGGGLVMDGQLVRGARGFAAEFGHMVLDDGGPRCPCGNRGCLEALASGSAIGRMAREAVAAGDGADSSLASTDSPSGRQVTAAAQAGDRLAVDVLARAGHWLGVGIASLVNSIDPEVVIIGGGAAEAGALLLDAATQAYHDRVVARRFRSVPPIVSARLGNDAGIIGAALLAADDRVAAHNHGGTQPM